MADGKKLQEENDLKANIKREREKASDALSKN